MRTRPIAFVDSAQTQLTSTGSLTISVTKPTLAQVGDIALGFSQIPGGSDSWTNPSGWTEIFDGSLGNGTGEISYGTVGSSDTSYTFTSNASGQLKCAVVAAFRNATYGVIGTMATATSTASSITMASPGIIVGFFRSNSSGVTIGLPASMTPIASDSDASGASWVLGYEVVSAGATGTRTATNSGSGKAAVLVGLYQA
jgi:hypothetical protein